MKKLERAKGQTKPELSLTCLHFHFVDEDENDCCVEIPEYFLAKESQKEIVLYRLALACPFLFQSNAWRNAVHFDEILDHRRKDEAKRLAELIRFAPNVLKEVPQVVNALTDELIYEKRTVVSHLFHLEEKMNQLEGKTFRNFVKVAIYRFYLDLIKKGYSAGVRIDDEKDIEKKIKKLNPLLGRHVEFENEEMGETEDESTCEDAPDVDNLKKAYSRTKQSVTILPFATIPCARHSGEKQAVQTDVPCFDWSIFDPFFLDFENKRDIWFIPILASKHSSDKFLNQICLAPVMLSEFAISPK